MGACTHLRNVAVSSSMLWMSAYLSHYLIFVRLCLTWATSLQPNVCIGTRSILCPTDRDPDHAAVIALAGCIDVTFLALSTHSPTSTRARSGPARRRLWDVLRKLVCACKDAGPVRARALERHARGPAAQVDLVREARLHRVQHHRARHDRVVVETAVKFQFCSVGSTTYSCTFSDINHAGRPEPP
jgi:hypothetical protein